MVRREIYLNHAGTSWPKPRVVSEAVRDAMNAPPSRWPQMFQEAHERMAHFFGVSHCEQILLTPGCTSSLAIAVSDALIPKGQRILTSHWEHHALHRPLLKRQSEDVRVEYIPVCTSGQGMGTASPIDLDWLERELSRGDVGLVAVTAACNVTGELLPFQDVIRLANQFGVMTLIDAAQIVGWHRLNFSTMGADFVAFGGHKGLQAPWGVGGLFLSDRARMVCVSATCEIPSSGNERGKASPRPGYCDVGSVDQFALAGLNAAIRMLGDQDCDVLLNNGRKQIEQLRTCFEEFEHIRTFGASDGKQSVPTLAVSVGGLSSREFAAILQDEGIVVGSGFQCAPLVHQLLETQGSGLVRFSVGIAQSMDEIDEVVDRLKLVLGS